MKPWFRCIVFVFAMSTSFADAQQPPDAGIEVVRPWARASTGLAQPAAAYLSIVNKGAQPIVLTGITTPVAHAADIHRTVQTGDVVRMEREKQIVLPPGARVEFAPGGLHIMLMNLEVALVRGRTFPMDLKFADGRSVEISVPVFPPGSRGPAQ
ncbi:MAG TPA: copper chaperone PCu(A)C [Lacipirellulaceae bacterium]|nr:copper chaperone PCu(A)C [Lacipirellulaceae bacterium]